MSSLNDLKALGYDVERTSVGSDAYCVSHDAIGIKIYCKESDAEIIDSLANKTKHRERMNPTPPPEPIAIPTPEQDLALAVTKASTPQARDAALAAWAQKYKPQ